MKETAVLIREVIEQVENELSVISDETAGIKISEEKWSKKEILGHLIDSASNNQQRFVRAALNDALGFPPYDQNKWVEVQQYNLREWKQLVELFVNMNRNIVYILNVIPQETGSNLCDIGKGRIVSLEFVVKDYLRHLKHHLDVILEK